ncbi:sigma-70 family RNA polymerase sigma factor [Bacillus sp. FJAT-51639]|uniref:Sigma-70 family RNA polymerase sigma factor n=2 Tax=Bacillus bruguierae TaxID=3127667 RepID=A0ABU8FD29_9BACI
MRDKKTSIELQQETKLERIQRIYDEGKVKQILTLEKSWEKYARQRLEEGENAFRIIYDNFLVSYIVRVTLNKFENAWKNKRIFRDDFESVFWEKLWCVCQEHSWNDEYYLYEKIKKALECAAYNLIKSKLRTDKRKANHQSIDLVASLEKFDSSFCIEGDVITKLLIKQYCDELEEQLLITYLENPYLSYRKIGRLHGINHPEKVKRILDSAKGKLGKVVA